MILNGKNPNMAAAVDRNRQINASHHTRGPFPCCGHDFWEQAKTMEFGDIIMCNRCHCYYAKIKHLPWLVENKVWMTNEIRGYSTNHLSGCWFAPVSARVTD
jgi:phage terminase large subunit GpA-like protein